MDRVVKELLRFRADGKAPRGHLPNRRKTTPNSPDASVRRSGRHKAAQKLEVSRQTFGNLEPRSARRSRSGRRRTPGELP